LPVADERIFDEPQIKSETANKKTKNSKKTKEKKNMYYDKITKGQVKITLKNKLRRSS
jgi:lysozyme family protein